MKTTSFSSLFVIRRKKKEVFFMIKNQSYDINQLDNLPSNITQSRSKLFSLMKLVQMNQGRTQKQPIDVHVDPNSDNLLAWKQHQERLVDFNTAVKTLKIRNDNRLRLGVLLQPKWEGNRELIAVDIDHRKDLVDQAQCGIIISGDIQAQVVKFALNHNFYVEISQSGEGLHLLQIGHKNDEKLIRNEKFEYYDSNRWICLTGNAVNSVKKLGTKDSVFEELEKMMFPNQKSIKETSSPNNSSIKSNLSIDEIIEKAKKAKNGDKFTELYNGISPSGDVSADDLAFINLLAFWTQKDPQKMDQIFRQSGRMRSKWDERHSAKGDTYGQMTIKLALANKQEIYQPKVLEDNRPEFEQIDKTQIKSYDDLIEAITKTRLIWEQRHSFKDKQGNIHQVSIGTKDIIDILINVAPFALIYNKNPQTDLDLYFYNYSTGIYSRNERDLDGIILAASGARENAKKVAKNILHILFCKHSDKIPVVQNLISTTNGKYLLAVNNGILNLKAKKLFPFSPTIYVTSKIGTNYNPNATQEPEYDGWSWSNSLKVNADGDDNKEKLLWQVCKAAIIGAFWLRQAVLLVDDGKGKTGKSTFEEALKYVVGDEHYANLRLFEFSDENKLLGAVDKRLIIGDENDVNKVIDRYDYLNPVISAEDIRVKKLFEDSKTTQIHAFVIQSSNGIPPFRNTTQAFFNRLVLIKFNHHYDTDKNWNVKHDYIKRKEFHEWLLWYVVNKVPLGKSLNTTIESYELISDTQTESDTIKNFVLNWLPQINSTVIPTGWLYSFYSTACAVDKMDHILSQNRFSREIMNNDLFTSNWQKKAKRPSEQNFLYDDVLFLVKQCNSIRWRYGAKAWFSVDQETITDKDLGISKSTLTVSKDEYTNKISDYHGQCFIKQ